MKTDNNCKTIELSITQLMDAICLRDKKPNEPLVDDSVLLFVAYHEISHIFSKEIGHSPGFWARFKLVLRIAMDHGLYKAIDYSKEPKEYCGVNVTSNPLFS